MQRQTLKNLLNKYDSNDIHQALRNAVTQNNLEDVSELLLHNASPEEKNSERKSALYLAMEMGNTEAVSRLKKINDTAINTIDDRTIIFLVLQVVSPLTMSLIINALKQVSFIHAVYAIKHEFDFYKKLPPNSKEVFEKLSAPLKSIVDKRIKGNNIPELTNLIEALKLPPNERMALIEDITKIKSRCNSVNDSEAVSILLNIYPVSKLRSLYYNYETAIYMLDQKIISFDLIDAMGQHRGSQDHIVWNDYSIFKLINPDIINFNDLDPKNPADVDLAFTILKRMEILIKEDCQHLLMTSGLSVKELCSLKVKKISGYCFTNIDLNAENIKFLSALSTIIDKEKIKSIKQLQTVLTPNGIEALRDNLLTVEQINQFDFGSSVHEVDPLKLILSDNGLACLRDKLLTGQDAVLLSKIIDDREKWSRSKNNNLKNLLTDEGVYALKKGIISVDDAKTYFLTHLCIKGAVEALQEKLITIGQLSQFTSSCPLNDFLNEIGLQALRDKLFSVEDILLSGQLEQLRELLNPIGLIALRKKLITPQEASLIKWDCLYSLLNNPYIIEALELKLVSPSDFYVDGKYEKGISESTTQYLIADYKNCDPTKSPAKFQNVIAVQSRCRSYCEHSKFTLFKEINHTKININNLHQLHEVLSLAERGKVVEAEERMAGLK